MLEHSNSDKKKNNQTKPPAVKKVLFMHLCKELVKPSKDANYSHVHQSLKKKSRHKKICAYLLKGAFPHILTAWLYNREARLPLPSQQTAFFF